MCAVDADTLLIKRHRNKRMRAHIYWIAFKQLKLHFMYYESSKRLLRLWFWLWLGVSASWKAMFKRAVNRHHDNKTQKKNNLYEAQNRLLILDRQSTTCARHIDFIFHFSSFARPQLNISHRALKCMPPSRVDFVCMCVCVYIGSWCRTQK